MSSTSKTDKFILTPYKCSDLVAHYAKLKRNEMHHIMMKGSAKVQRQILDLETLNNSQNFIGQAPLQGTTKNTYEVNIFTLADAVQDKTVLRLIYEYMNRIQEKNLYYRNVERSDLRLTGRDQTGWQQPGK